MTLSALDGELFAAIRANDPDRVRNALAAGADVNAQEDSDVLIDRDRYDSTNSPLSVAVALGHLGIVRCLLAQPGVNVDIKDSFACATPLTEAARRGLEEIALALLAAGADPNCMDKWERKAAAALAMYPGPESLVVRLLEAGTDLAAHGSQLTELAVFYKRTTVLEWLRAHRPK
jgi:ankyrin repeat protein